MASRCLIQKLHQSLEKIPGLQGASYLVQGRRVPKRRHEAYTACLHITISELISCSPHDLLAFFLSSAEMPSFCSFQDFQGSGVSSLGDTATCLLAFQLHAILLQSKTAQGLHAFESFSASFELLRNWRMPCFRTSLFLCEGKACVLPIPSF